MNLKSYIGLRVKAARHEKGLTQEQLAELLDISLNHLANIETGKKFVSAELLTTISKKLKVSPSFLFYSPEFISTDTSTLTNVDKIIEDLDKDKEIKHSPGKVMWYLVGGFSIFAHRFSEQLVNVERY